MAQAPICNSYDCLTAHCAKRGSMTVCLAWRMADPPGQGGDGQGGERGSLNHRSTWGVPKPQWVEATL